jgi:hypothetical protein
LRQDYSFPFFVIGPVLLGCSPTGREVGEIKGIC